MCYLLSGSSLILKLVTSFLHDGLVWRIFFLVKALTQGFLAIHCIDKHSDKVTLYSSSHCQQLFVRLSNGSSGGTMIISDLIVDFNSYIDDR